MAAMAPAASVGKGEGETVFDTVVQLTGDLRTKEISKTSVTTAVTEEGRSEQNPPEVVPGKMHLPPHWRHAGPSAEQRAVLDAATAEALKSIHGDVMKKSDRAKEGNGVPLS